MKKIVSLISIAVLIIGFYLYARNQILMTESSLISDKTYWQEISKQKSTALQNLIMQFQSGNLSPASQTLLVQHAPKVWWHTRELFPAQDPLVFFQDSELWFREVLPFFPFWTKREVPVSSDTSNFLTTKFETFSTVQPVSRLLEKQGLLAGLAGFELRYSTNIKSSSTAPLLWRLSHSELFKTVQPAASNELYLPIEFWYFSPHNPVDIYIGTHNGDWESFLILFHVTDSTASAGNTELSFTPLYYNTSSHGNSSWHCPEEIQIEDQRWQLFSALGTHATYTQDQVQWRIYPDRTGRGAAWDTWLNLRPLVQEAYYGFSGSWGRTSWIHFMNAPLGPGPLFKYLPRSSLQKSQQDWINLNRCPKL